MKITFKQLSSFILPVTVLILIPLIIEKEINLQLGLLLLVGIILIAFGIYIISITVRLFMTKGEGTLAPWSHTSKFVIEGPYAYVRNPMIIGVLIVLLGESLLLHSYGILIWAVLFFFINNMYFIYSEEPGLEKRFGEEYRKYMKNVPRWIPRLWPYRIDM